MLDQYKMFGDFYKLKFDADNIITCRSVLEIIKNDFTTNCDGTSIHDKIDAIFVLHNPGDKCKPINSNVGIDLITIDQISRFNKPLIEANSDPTLRQLIRVMNDKQWEKIRIINLSDICSSSDYQNQIKSINKFSNSDAHSIFSVTRKSELRTKIKIEAEFPLICAWTYDPDPNLIKIFFESLAGNLPRTGLSDGKEGYGHPCPWSNKQKEKWVDDIVKLISLE